MRNGEIMKLFNRFAWAFILMSFSLSGVQAVMPALEPAINDFQSLSIDRINQKKKDWQALVKRQQIKGAGYLGFSAVTALVLVAIVVFIMFGPIKKSTTVEDGKEKTKKFDDFIEANTAPKEFSLWCFFILKQHMGKIILAVIGSLVTILGAFLYNKAATGWGSLWDGLGRKDFSESAKALLRNITVYQKALTIFVNTPKSNAVPGSISEKIDLYAVRNLMADHRAFIDSFEEIFALFSLLLNVSFLDKKQKAFFQESMQTLFDLINDFIVSTVRPAIARDATVNAENVTVLTEKICNEMEHFIVAVGGALFGTVKYADSQTISF